MYAKCSKEPSLCDGSFECSKEPSNCNGSFECPHYIFWLRNNFFLSITLLSGGLLQPDLRLDILQ